MVVQTPTVEPNEIDVTPEMIDAGAEIIFLEAAEVASGWRLSSDVARMVWNAMYGRRLSCDQGTPES